jgi:RimJ/RimL family protein N-acetyltransferase
VIQFAICRIQDSDRAWVREWMIETWGTEMVVAHGIVYRPHELNGFCALMDGEPIGLITLNLVGDACEIVTLDSKLAKNGIGTALIQAAQTFAHELHCSRLWLVTTNDNITALRFYQKCRFRIKAIYPNAIDAARKIKPQIPELGEHGIPIRDEIEMEMTLMR